MHPADLALYHRNPRLGNVEAIAGSLRANGQYKPIVVNAGTHTGRPNEVLAGNHTLKAIRDLAEKHPDDERWQTVLVHVIDVDDDRAARIVLADNRTSELGTMDDTALAEMIDSLDGDLVGTGYDDDDLAEILEAAGDELLDEDGEGAGDGGEDVEDAPRGTGESLALWGATVGEPDVVPETGTVWRMGHHVLVVCDVNRDHGLYVPHLTDEHMLYPYPSLLAPYVQTLEDRPAVFVQPSKYLAGWFITKWNRLRSSTPAEQVTR